MRHKAPLAVKAVISLPSSKESMVSSKVIYERCKIIYIYMYVELTIRRIASRGREEKRMERKKEIRKTLIYFTYKRWGTLWRS